MRKHTEKPKHIITNIVINIVCFTLSVILGLATGQTVRAAKSIDDWHYYNSYAASLAQHNTDHSSDFNDHAVTGTSFKDHYEEYNVTDASDDIIALVDMAKTRVRTELGGYSALLWEHFGNLQVKDCDLEYAEAATVAFYVPEDNTIYCNRASLYSSSMNEYRFQTFIHELIHALLEKDSSVLNNQAGAFHEGLAEYLSQSIAPTKQPSYYPCYCIAEVFVKDNGLDKAIELVMSGQAEESINQRLGKENLIQTINAPLYMASLDPKHELANTIILDVYFHYIEVTGVDVERNARLLLNRIPLSYSELPKRIYFDNISRDHKTSRLFLDNKNTQPFQIAYSYRLNSIKHSFLLYRAC